MSELVTNETNDLVEHLHVVESEITTPTPLEEKYNLLCSIGDVVGHDSLHNLLQHKSSIIAYDGFEPSGKMHIAQGLLRAHNVNKFTQAGIKFKFWIADWFALMNLKLGGDLSKIQRAGREMIATWKACGMDMTNVEFIWSSDEITKRSGEYWKLVLDISTKFNLHRVKRCTQIMGREESDELAASQIFYPVMQCADIFFMNCDICSLGRDQLKVNMLALEYCDKIKRKLKPVIISHPMIMGLDGSDKMSKSNPDNAIFMDDNPNEVKRKIMKAFCEPGNIEKNPLLDWIKHLILPIVKSVYIPPNIKWNESEKIYTDYDTVASDFKSGVLHPSRLKESMIKHINELLGPVQSRLKHDKSD
jgi:tyrosyl-tRNA synthetase